jgi:rubrerythrin
MVEATASLHAAVSTRAPAGASALQTSRSWQLRFDQGGRVEIQCARCGYGAVVTSPPRRCPMCGGDGWRVARRVSAFPTLSE